MRAVTATAALASMLGVCPTPRWHRASGEAGAAVDKA